jgi:hypothetical protein
MTVSSSYGRAVPAGKFEGLFRAYVEEVTTRRDCTTAAFPSAADFAPSGRGR